MPNSITSQLGYKSIEEIRQNIMVYLNYQTRWKYMM